MPAGYLDHPRPLAFAHRGGAGHFPENSWPAFEHAIGLGYAYLETDVHATADGVLVAFHDKTLDRATDAAGPISALPYREVAAARIGGTEPIPLLAELLAAWPQARFNIDVKDKHAAAPLAEVVRRAAAWDRVCVVSFSGRRLAAARRAMSRPVCTATTPAAVGAIRAGCPAALLSGPLRRAGVRCAQIPVRLATAGFIRRAHAAGLHVHVWTVNDAGQMSRLLDLGADGIMTDNTELLRDVLTARGQWHPQVAS
ncbi:MAG: glycerophosphodiester phosphodiesterase [Streptosporangiaceae bacterium]